MNNYKNEVVLFISGLISGTFSHIVINGFGNNYLESILNGIPTGAQLCSFPLSNHILSNLSKKYQEIIINKKFYNIPKYLIGGTGAAIIFTSISYPTKVLLSKYSKKKEQFSFKGSKDFFIDRLGISIGSPIGLDLFQKNIGFSDCNIINWVRGHLLVHSAQITGRFFAFPIHNFRYNTNLINFFKIYFKNTSKMMITSDCMSVVKPIINNII